MSQIILKSQPQTEADIKAHKLTASEKTKLQEVIAEYTSKCEQLTPEEDTSYTAGKKVKAFGLVRGEVC